MGQCEVLECLKKHKEPISRKKIADEIGDNVVKVSHSITKLLSKREIKCVEYDRVKAGKMLGMKSAFRRTRFYYVEIKMKDIIEWQE